MTLISYSRNEIAESEINLRVQKHIPLARKIAWQIHGRVRDLLDIDDLIQIGMMALVEAAQRFQDTGEATFGTYAAIRVKGALVDYLRASFTLSRTAVQRRDRIVAAEKSLRNEGNISNDPVLLAAKIGITVDELHVWQNQVAHSAKKSLDEIYDDHSSWFTDAGPTPEDALLKTELRQRLADMLKRLEKREALVLQLYYVEELNLEEISEILSLTVGRVSQIKKSAIGQIREWMKDE
jgi:RNA polymerase sigma factor for flagellar operon FliA